MYTSEIHSSSPFKLAIVTQCVMNSNECWFDKSNRFSFECAGVEVSLEEHTITSTILYHPYYPAFYKATHNRPSLSTLNPLGFSSPNVSGHLKQCPF